jgi:hypothetical protein
MGPFASGLSEVATLPPGRAATVKPERIGTDPRNYYY